MLIFYDYFFYRLNYDNLKSLYSFVNAVIDCCSRFIVVFFSYDFHF